ncbi:uncharacterized protein LOC135833629 [Planococcus citri]|uniref:uncharacterized protein LOC135833629 n=1 Tax=Planococcus citri TaxID=170843 RepID=UPI0031F8ACA7
MIVLAWLARPPSDWKTFVRNRVVKIVEKFPASHWSHVRSGENPADLATRGLSTKLLMESPIWLNGPDFVKTSSNEMNSVDIDDEMCKPYFAKPKSVSLVMVDIKCDVDVINSCSSYEKIRCIYATASACVRRWKSLIRDRQNVPVKIEATDVILAEKWLIRVVQQEAYSADILRLKSNKAVKRRSWLRRYTPFIDEEGIVRAKSRLQNAPIPEGAKNPIILPANHHLVKLYVCHLHEKFFHAGRSWLMTNLSANYIFTGGISRLIKTTIYNCRECIERFVQAKPQQMADLPADRVTPRPPFQVVGIDFTGAFHLKCSYHRTTKYMKAYACVFVCFVTRAVHIELVPSLSTEDFLNALKCFIARRGVPITIYSDNGTNFRGGERYLNFENDDIQKYSRRNTISWKFNPPYTPHRGGIWESAVKSAKRYLPKITDEQRFNENELRTLLTQVECILNSRPLAYCQTSEPLEEVLTPGHFLVGRNLSVLPEPSEPPAGIKLSAQYEANCSRVRDFWKVWSQDYLNQLKARVKWTDERPNLEVGQIVLLRKTTNEPGRWPLARITKTFPDRDDLVRTVEVRTPERVRVVPTIHVVPLPTT